MTAEYLQSPELLMGQTSREVVRWLLEKHSGIETVNFVIYRPRLPNPPDLKEKLKTGPDDIPLELRREEVLLKGFNPLLKRLNPELALGINSNVIFKDSEKGQIPMMDFECQVDGRNIRQIDRFIRLIGLSGFFMLSGASYHFIGKEIFRDQREWERFLGKCLLSGLSDPRYIGHALDRGFSTLRISATKLHPLEPFVENIIV